RCGGLEIERGVKMRRAPHGNVTCFAAPGDLVHERRDVSEHIDEVDAIAHERACLHHFPKGAYRGSATFEQQMRDGYAIAQGERACWNHYWLARRLIHGHECSRVVRRLSDQF